MSFTKYTRNLVFLPMVLLAYSCSTPGSIKAPANLSMNIADANFNALSPVGSQPLKLDTNQVAMWLTFEQPGAPTGYALLIKPNKFRGEEQEFKITPKEGIQSQENSSTTIGTSFYNEYFDLVLRGHRALMNGDIETTKDTINKLKQSYSETYGGLALELLVNISENNPEKILASVDEIKRIYPDSALLKSLEGGQPAQGAN